MSDALIPLISAGLAGRLRSLAMVIDRLDRLESGSGSWLAQFNNAELAESATTMTLRMLNTVSDQANFTILKALSASESQAMRHLMDMTGSGRLLLSERLNDLVQVGLAARLIDTDHAQITAAGAAIVQLVEEISAQTSVQYLAKTDG